MVDHRQGTPNWDRLPDDLKYHILALVPTSQSKLLLRGVARSWRRLLMSPSAYSSSLDDCEDLYTSVAPHAWTDSLEPLRALSIVSTPQPYQQGGPALATLAHLPMGRLVALRLRFDDLSVLNAWAMPHLTRLDLEIYEWLGPLTVDRCPALRELNLVTYDEQAGTILSNVGQLEYLTSCSYIDENISNVRVPDGCELSVQVSALLPSPMPGSAAQHLVSLKLSYCAWLGVESGDSCFNFDLSPLSVCQQLRQLTLVQDWMVPQDRPYGNDADGGYAWALKGVELLPASLTSFTVLGAVMPAVSTAAVASYAGGVFQLMRGAPKDCERSAGFILNACPNACCGAHRFDVSPSTIPCRGLLSTLQGLPVTLTELRLSVRSMSVMNSGPVFHSLRTLDLCIDWQEPRHPDASEFEPLNINKFPALEVFVFDSRDIVYQSSLVPIVCTDLQGATGLRSLTYSCEDILELDLPANCEVNIVTCARLGYAPSYPPAELPIPDKAKATLVALTVRVFEDVEDLRLDGPYVMPWAAGVEGCDRLREYIIEDSSGKILVDVWAFDPTAVPTCLKTVNCKMLTYPSFMRDTLASFEGGLLHLSR